MELISSKIIHKKTFLVFEHIEETLEQNLQKNRKSMHPTEFVNLQISYVSMLLEGIFI